MPCLVCDLYSYSLMIARSVNANAVPHAASMSNVQSRKRQQTVILRSRDCQASPEHVPNLSLEVTETETFKEESADHI